jgi:hypothetical protein
MMHSLGNNIFLVAMQAKLLLKEGFLPDPHCMIHIPSKPVSGTNAKLYKTSLEHASSPVAWAPIVGLNVASKAH